MCKVHTSSHEITNEPYVSSNYGNTTKTVTPDLTTNYDAETNNHLLKISKRLVKTVNTTSKTAKIANWIRIVTDGSNLNSKVKNPILALPLNILGFFIGFSGFNRCNVRFGTACIITIIIQQAIVI